VRLLDVVAERAAHDRHITSSMPSIGLDQVLMCGMQRRRSVASGHS
jgi:hypothetical protein